MPKKSALGKFSTSQTKHVLEKVLVGKLKKAEAARTLGVSRKTIYFWLRKYKTSGKGTQKAPKSRERFTRNILRIVTANPEFGPQKISKELKKRQKYLSSRSVWVVLKDLKLNSSGERVDYAYKYREPTQAKDPNFPVHLRLTPEVRKRMAEEVILSGRKVNEVCTEFQVPRKTFAKWKNRYLAAQKAGKDILLALSDQHPEGPAHPRGASEQAVRAVLDLVVENPVLSSHKIADALPVIGNHGVQNILNRNNLNLHELRQAYSKARKEVAVVEPVPAGFFDRIRLVLEQFVPSLAPAPPPEGVPPYRRAGPLFKFFFISSILASLITYSTTYWINLLFSVPAGQAVGFIFAAIALFMGSIFFLYSLKYYLTLALVLSFSQTEQGEGLFAKGRRKGIINWLLRGEGSDLNGKVDSRSAAGLTPNLENVTLKRHPYVSVQIPLFNEKRVVERILKATSSFDYPEYEVILADDSTDETSQIIRDYLKKSIKGTKGIKSIKGEGWTLTQAEVKPGVTVKHLHRTSRSGFKGGALSLALSLTAPRAEFISVFDADFVPYPDTLELFLKYFQATALPASASPQAMQAGGTFIPKGSNIAAVQGYQWHVLNKSENWITRGVRSEYAGSYVIERSGTEIYSGLKQISGAVYMIRRDVLEEVGWETSITEDFQLTLKLYDAGYRIVYTPYIQAPAECVSTLKRLIRQRMRWAEGHSNNIRRMFFRLMYGKWLMVNGKREFTKSPLTTPEKLEFLYLSPYYLQAFFFLIGTISWLLAETVFPAGLPFWTSLWGWSLVLTNFLSLPLMNSVGMFLEESEERDYQGIISFVALSYLLVPFQAYASIKGLIQKEEGPWFRTPKTGHITDVFTRGRFYRFISGILPGRSQVQPANLMVNGQLSMAKKNVNNQSSVISNYLSLATANNQFNSFSIRPRKKRWLGKAVFSLLLALSVTVYSATHGVPEVLATPITDPFYPSTTDPASLTGSNTRELETSVGTSDANTSITISKNGPSNRAFRYPPMANNNNASSNATNCASLGHASGNGEGWIYNTPFDSNGKVAPGDWDFYIDETDGNASGVAGIIICVWAVTITGSQIDGGGTLLVEYTDITPTTDLLDNANNNIKYTTTEAEIPLNANEYMYVEYWLFVVTRPGANDTSTFTIGPDPAEDPRIVTQGVTIPEDVVVLLVVAPFIPLVAMWMRRRRALAYA